MLNLTTINNLIGNGYDRIIKSSDGEMHATGPIGNMTIDNSSVSYDEFNEILRSLNETEFDLIVIERQLKLRLLDD